MRADLSLPAIAILGPTASGKSSLGLQLAEHLMKNGRPVEIVACDSVQIYRGFDLGSAKPSQDEQAAIPHHMIDIRDASENFDAATYKNLAAQAIREIQARDHIPILIGGTGLYFRALSNNQQFHDLPHDAELRHSLAQLSNNELHEQLKKIDPERAAAIHPHDHFRLARAMEIATLKTRSSAPFMPKGEFTAPHFFTIIRNPDRKKLHERIARRAQQMLQIGLLEEVEELLKNGAPRDCKAMQSIGYRQCVEYLQGEIPKSELADRIIFATRQYAKRQCTWFKKVPYQRLEQNLDSDPQAIIAAMEKTKV